MQPQIVVNDVRRPYAREVNRHFHLIAGGRVLALAIEYEARLAGVDAVNQPQEIGVAVDREPDREHILGESFELSVDVA
jgi:hypothetical protein